MWTQRRDGPALERQSSEWVGRGNMRARKTRISASRSAVGPQNDREVHRCEARHSQAKVRQESARKGTKLRRLPPGAGRAQGGCGQQSPGERGAGAASWARASCRLRTRILRAELRGKGDRHLEDWLGVPERSSPGTAVTLWPRRGGASCLKL